MKSKTKKTGLLTLIIAILFGLAAVFLTMSLIKDSTKTVGVLIAKDNIEEGDPLSKDQFEIKQIHPSGRPGTAVNVNELDLNGIVASKGMLKGDILREEHLIKIADVNQELPLISTRIKALGNDNLVGAEIPVQSISGILDGVKKGDRISIVSVYKDDEADDIISKTILTDIEVLAIKASKDDGKGVVAVALTQDEFEKLSLARDTGTVHIAIQPLGVTVSEKNTKVENKVLDTEKENEDSNNSNTSNDNDDSN